MKTAEETLKEHTGHAHPLMDAATIKAMKEYAALVAIETLHSAIDRAKIKRMNRNDEDGNKRFEVDKFSILSTPIKTP